MIELASITGQADLLAPIWLAILWAMAAYLLVLGLAVFVTPVLTRKFLSGFAQSTRANLNEAGLRAIVGMAFVGASAETKQPDISTLLGLFLVVSAIVLALLPGLHRSFAVRATAGIFKIFAVFGLLSMMLAALLAWFIA